MSSPSNIYMELKTECKASKCSKIIFQMPIFFNSASCLNFAETADTQISAVAWGTAHEHKIADAFSC